MKRKNLENSRKSLKEAFAFLNNMHGLKIEEVKKLIAKSIKNIDELTKSQTIISESKTIVPKPQTTAFTKISYNKTLDELNNMIKEQEKKLLEIQQKKEKSNENEGESFLLD